MSLSSVIDHFRAYDTTSSVGAGKTGLAFGDFTAKYLTPGGTLTSLTTETITTLGTYAAPTSAAHIRVKELNNSDPTKGDYEIHIHDTIVAAAGKELKLFFSASGAMIDPIVIPLHDLPGRVPSALTSNGNMKSSLLEIIATALTETSGGLIAAAFKKFFDKATPTGTINSIPDAVAGATGGLSIVGSGMALTSAERTTLAVAIEAALLNEGDGQALIAAIIQRIETDLDAADLSVQVIAATVRDAILNRVLSGNHDTNGTVGKLLQFLDALISSRVASGSQMDLVDAPNANARTSIANTVNTVLTASHGAGSWQQGAGGGGLTGANEVTITVDDGTDPIANAKVRLTDGVHSEVRTTDADGQVQFSADDGTWRVTITKFGYSFSPVDLEVDGDTDETYSMDQVTITPSEAGQVTGHYTATVDGVPAAGIKVSMQQTKPSPVAGYANDSNVRNATSGVNGLVQFPNLFPGATYQFWKGNTSSQANRKTIVIPVDAEETIALESIIGSP